MNETIEQMVMNILNQVSDRERFQNKHLSLRTVKVLRALQYLKAASGSKKNSDEKLGA